MNRIGAQVLIVGAGPAGLSAALAASEQVEVTLVDDNPDPGGQIWRAERGKITSTDAAKLFGAIDSGRVTILSGTSVFAAVSPNRLIATTEGGTVELQFEKLIIATGARERFVPFPGWILPNVFGAGGLQALVKGGVNVSGKRVVVAGTGPLLLAVADYLKVKGAEVLLIAEQARAMRINRFAFGLWRNPGKIAQAVRLRSRLFGTPYLTDCWITKAIGEDKIERVELTRKGKKWRVECDFVACGFHLVPSTELAAMLGCEINNGSVVVDYVQRTTIKNVYCAGEPTGVGGVEASLIEGKIAGYAATGQITKAEQHITNRAKAHRFATALNTAFALRDELKSLVDNDTVVCRCEDVDYGRL
ncbi:MAG: FAD-dependent oxidoreductase, partial [Pyrinomonadaceae bacterium]